MMAHPWHHDAPMASSTACVRGGAREAAAPQSVQATPEVGRDRSVSRSTKLSGMVDRECSGHSVPAGRPDVHYNGPMSALRFVSLVALSVWLGGLIAIGSVAAPAAFAVLDRALAPPRSSARSCGASIW